jgi:hypothetical protein
MKKSLLLFIASIFIFNSGNAQTINWFEMIADPSSNFYDVQQSFQNYFASKDSTEKGKGWKQFKRWEWMMEQRLYPTGNRSIMNNAIGAYNDQLAANNYTVVPMEIGLFLDQ